MQQGILATNTGQESPIQVTNRRRRRHISKCRHGRAGKQRAKPLRCTRGIPALMSSFVTQARTAHISRIVIPRPPSTPSVALIGVNPNLTTQQQAASLAQAAVKAGNQSSATATFPPAFLQCFFHSRSSSSRNLDLTPMV
ncbi:hypothetical protein GQ607_003077 [Colletotrichum asianum]|uniref:Uncharacterized protein n=1 Tax=Colletotrichum asianum TaxID=702518 RepID=A0A8H3WMA8_9PEZI|nr:hypothetical protein GQ607_003077 [Colletotrichum asianum]